MKDIINISDKLNTKFLGKKLIYLEEINSTQDFLKGELKKGAEQGLLVLTENQTKGKGTNRKGMVYKTGRESDFFFFT